MTKDHPVLEEFLNMIRNPVANEFFEKRFEELKKQINDALRSSDKPKKKENDSTGEV